ncbi:hypothetical protein ACTWPT_56470 [Nonomuraea sp. 3N208]|uniref:hypothetical protein n=1 Tax=Nonomuraea sp. 3N208 TaxID=3457421 RepID=UPI003FCF5577
MQKVARRTMRVSVIAMAVTTIGLATAPPASALTFYSDPPIKAGNVATMGSSYNLSGGGQIQIRRGIYNHYVYYWGRVSSPASKYNSDYYLKFVVTGGSCDSPGSTTKDINRTTYTKAVRAQGYQCSYRADVIQSSTGNRVGSASYTSPRP